MSPVDIRQNSRRLWVLTAFVLCRSVTPNLHRVAVSSVRGCVCSLIFFLRAENCSGVRSLVWTVFQPSLSFRPPLVSCAIGAYDNAHGFKCVFVSTEFTVSYMFSLKKFKIKNPSLCSLWFSLIYPELDLMCSRAFASWVWLMPLPQVCSVLFFVRTFSSVCKNAGMLYRPAAECNPTPWPLLTTLSTLV